MKIIKLTLLGLFSIIFGVQAQQSLQFEGKKFEFYHVKAAVVDFEGEEVLRIVRDLESLPFEKGIDEPTFLQLADFEMENGSIEVRILSRLLPDAPAFSKDFQLEFNSKLKNSKVYFTVFKNI